jgi:hypothetical protein
MTQEKTLDSPRQELNIISPLDANDGKVKNPFYNNNFQFQIMENGVLMTFKRCIEKEQQKHTQLLVGKIVANFKHQKKL